MGPLSSLFSGLWGYLAAAIVAALVSGGGGIWLTHKVDDDSYKALQLADSQALVASQKADAAAQRAFDAKWVAANATSADALKTLTAQRETQAQQLSSLLVSEGQKDASLAACLALPLPTDVLQQLTH